jgi:hypothetical protein
MRKPIVLSVTLLALVFATVSIAQQPRKPRPAADRIRQHLGSVDKNILDMAKDFPEEKYSFKLKPEMRSFGEILVHVASGNVFAAKLAGGDTKAQWDELDPKNYKDKAAIVALLEKSFADSEAAVKKVSDDALAKDAEPWMNVFEHNAEHYGLLVGYYRANGMVPPASRPQK